MVGVCCRGWAARPTDPNWDIDEIKYDELSDGMKKGIIILVDVRNPDELKADGRIPGAINIPSDEVRDAFRLDEAEFKNKYGFEQTFSNIVFSCKSGRQAASAIDSLKGTIAPVNLRLYKGSFNDWQENGGPINK